MTEYIFNRKLCTKDKEEIQEKQVNKYVQNIKKQGLTGLQEHIY